MITRNGIILDGIGVELETCNTDPNKIAESLVRLNLTEYVRRERDASSETFLRMLTRKLMFMDPVGVLDGVRNMPNITTGIELITAPLYFSEALTVIPSLLGELSRLGEMEKSTRGAIHVHIGFPQSLQALKSALIFSTVFESLFFQLGGMGYGFRGETNKAIYCRPHGLQGPPAVMCEDGRVRQVSSVRECLTADNTGEFWRAYGVIASEVKRYHPARYYGINILSVLLHGTIEFRHFNVSLNPKLLLSVMRLCQASAELLMKAPLRRLQELPESPSTVKQDNEQLLEVLFGLIEEFSEAFPLSSWSKNELRDALRATPTFILPAGYVKTHLWGKFVLGRSIYEESLRSVIPVEELTDSGFIDSHQNEVRRLDFTAILNR